MKLYLLLIIALAVPGVAPAESGSTLLSEQGSRNYIRMSRDQSGPAALEVSIVRFARTHRTDPVEIDLVSAVHVGDRAYYQELNRRFRDYDVVLYELVAPAEGEVVESDTRVLGFASALQGGMQELLALSHQLDEIDYAAENFVHADLTPDQFLESMSNRGESMFSLFFKAWAVAMSTPAHERALSDYELFAALLSGDRPRAFKRMMARQFNDMDRLMSMLEGGENGSTLITVRNQKALEVLQEQLGEGHRKLAIFYGAGHMPDFAERLQTDFSLVPVSQTWLEAWDLRDPTGE